MAGKVVVSQEDLQALKNFNLVKHDTLIGVEQTEAPKKRASLINKLTSAVKRAPLH